MNKMKIWMPAILFIFFLAVSCEKEDPIVESQVLAEYLESLNSPAKDYVNTDMPAMRSAEQVRTLNTLNKVYIMDIRSATDFAAGHIENAVNVPAMDVLNHIESVDLSGYDEVSVVCYTGQTAAWATCLLRLMGYDNVYSMKFGMCSWHADFADRWNNNTKSTYSTQFVTTATAKGPAGDLPVLATGQETGGEILEVRVDEVLTEGFSEASITSTEVYANLDNYYIVNYWPEAEYLDPGHIEGAVQYTPKQSIKLSADLKTLPTDKTIVVYCYTGQTSANLAAYLRVLGYDARSLLFGTNGMIYNDMTISKWSASQIMGYEYVQ